MKVIYAVLIIWNLYASMVGLANGSYGWALFNFVCFAICSISFLKEPKNEKT